MEEKSGHCWMEELMENTVGWTQVSDYIVKNREDYERIIRLMDVLLTEAKAISGGSIA